MMKRRVPQSRYETVLELTTAIAQPEAGNEPTVDATAAEKARAKLVALFQSRQSTGTPDPFLTETVADFTNDAAEAVRLYRMALEQCAAFPGEPTHTKRQGLVERLLELGHTVDAQKELASAQRNAFAAGDADTIKDLNALARKMAV